MEPPTVELEKDKTLFDWFQVKMGGAGLGLFMPWFILISQLVLLAHVMRIRRYAIRHQIRDLRSPTLLTEPGWLAGVLNVGMVVLVPAVAQVLLIKQFKLSPGLTEVEMFIISATPALGFHILWVAARIDQARNRPFWATLFGGPVVEGTAEKHNKANEKYTDWVT